MKFEAVQLREFAARYTIAWCSREPARVAEFFSPKGSLRVNDKAPAVGREAVSEIARGFMEAFPDLHLSMDDIMVQDERVVYHWTFAGTNTGPGGTGKLVRFSGSEDWTFGEDGLIAESLGHFDESEYRRQLEQ
jgi:predicted ester cyclase